ncbi:hypothetical protein DL767_005714 [Monosporascus sp. MG133]|nr:hypothetical protein DL767_005714 [Monosporascus sp. MG133]
MFLHLGASLHGHEYSNQSPNAAIQTPNFLFRSVFSAPTSPISKSHASTGATVPLTEIPLVQSPSQSPPQSQPPSAETVHAVRRTTPPSTPPSRTVRRRPRPLSDRATYGPSYGPTTPRTPEPSVGVREPEHDYFLGPPRRAATTSWNETMIVGSPASNASRTPSSVHRTSGRRRPARKCTTYILAQPPPKKQRKLHHTRPQLYLQMQQLSSEGRPSPVIDVYPSSAFPKTRVAPLLKRYPRISRVKPELGSRDIMLLSYGSNEQSSDSKSDSDDKTLKSRDLIAILSPTRTTEEKIEVVLADGIVWTATTRPNGSYDFISETVKARWVHKTTDDSYTFSIINPNSRKHPIMATLSRVSLGVLDCYTEWEETFILVSASWVALHQGWASTDAVVAFASWKALLLAIAIGSSVGPAYDTSSTLISPVISSPNESAFDIATKLTRWDAIYFVQAARRGYLFEQEWAFGGGLPTVISFITNVLVGVGFEDTDSLEPLVGVFVSHASHLLSVLALYQLGLVIWGQGSRRLAFIAALLHVLSPAGLFLSAPYAESAFALLSFLGYLFFAKGIVGDKKRTVAHDVSVVAAGMWFGFAATFRSNGIFGGLPFAMELLGELASSPPTLTSVRKRLALVVGGSAVAVGFAVPQIVAYLAFCSGSPETEEGRSWCSKALPSIYSFVQERYWNVGFLRYWMPENIPLFLLAAPVLYLLMRSGVETLRAPSSLLRSGEAGPTASLPAAERLLRSMALSQLVLAALAITNYHVQIITRLSSGYPLWYFWLAGMLGSPTNSAFGSKVVVFIVMYATIQGALFASFLPPA